MLYNGHMGLFWEFYWDDTTLHIEYMFWVICLAIEGLVIRGPGCRLIDKAMPSD